MPNSNNLMHRFLRGADYFAGLFESSMDPIFTNYTLNNGDGYGSSPFYSSSNMPYLNNNFIDQLKKDSETYNRKNFLDFNGGSLNFNIFNSKQNNAPKKLPEILNTKKLKIPETFKSDKLSFMPENTALTDFTKSSNKAISEMSLGNALALSGSNNPADKMLSKTYADKAIDLDDASSTVTPVDGTTKGISEKAGNIGAAIGMVSDIAGSFMPEKTEYAGRRGNVSRTMDNVYDTASDLAMSLGPAGMLVGGIMKGGAFLGKGVNALGGGTDGMTTTDAILGSSFFNLTPFGLINGFGGKKSHSFTRDDELFAQAGNSYGGTSATTYDALEMANKKYGAFSSGARHDANDFIDEAHRQQEVLDDVMDEALDRFAIRNSRAAFNGLRRSYNLGGGYDLKAVRIGQKGMSFTSVLDKGRDMLKRTLKDPFEVYLESLPENQRDSTNFRTKRYWELNGKPKNFEEAKKRRMFSLKKDGWHANSVAYNEDLDEYEFMKSPLHKSIWMEEAWYNGLEPILKQEYKSNPDIDPYNEKYYDKIPLEGEEAKNSESFRNDYELDKTGPYWKYIRRKISSHKQGGEINPIQSEINFVTPSSEINFVVPSTEISLVSIDDLNLIEEFLKGGSINIIPEGALHARKHNMETEGITKKGIPVVAEKEGGEIELQAEIEREEIIFRLEVTEKLEELYKKYSSEESSQKEKDEAALEAGKLLTEEIIHNTIDNTKNLL